MLMNMIGYVVADAGGQALVIITVTIVGNAGRCAGQIGKYGSLADFEPLHFEA
jgi:hypothetical protein